MKQTLINSSIETIISESYKAKKPVSYFEISLFYEKTTKPEELVTHLNSIALKHVPKLVSIPSKKKSTENYPESYTFYDLITVNKNGRKCIMSSSKRKSFACLEKDCINIVSKYNYCKSCRDFKYEKEYSTFIKTNSNNTMVSLAGIHYKNVGFYISPQSTKFAQSRIWWLNPKNEVMCSEGRFIDLICSDGWKARRIHPDNLDYRQESLTFALDKPYQTGDGIWHIPLNGERGFKKEALIESDSYKLVSKYKTWSVSSDGYAVSGKVSMHRLVRNFPKGKVVDHLNRNRLDNRLSNLQIKTSKENAKNRTTNPNGYEGVKWDKDKNKWMTCYKGIEIYWTNNNKLCALCYDSVRHYVTGEIAGLNDMTQDPKEIDYWKLPSHILLKLDEIKLKYTNFHKVKACKDGWMSEATIKLGPFKTDSEAAMVRDVLLLLFPKGNEKQEFNFDPSKYTAKNMGSVIHMLFSPKTDDLF